MKQMQQVWLGPCTFYLHRLVVVVGLSRACLTACSRVCAGLAEAFGVSATAVHLVAQWPPAQGHLQGLDQACEQWQTKGCCLIALPLAVVHEQAVCLCFGPAFNVNGHLHAQGTMSLSETHDEGWHHLLCEALTHVPFGVNDEV